MALYVPIYITGLTYSLENQFIRITANDSARTVLYEGLALNVGQDGETDFYIENGTEGQEVLVYVDNLSHVGSTLFKGACGGEIIRKKSDVIELGDVISFGGVGISFGGVGISFGKKESIGSVIEFKDVALAFDGTMISFNGD